MMKLSRFVRIVPSKTGVILFNTINSCIIELTQDYFSDGEIIWDRFSSDETTYLQENQFFIDDRTAIKKFQTSEPLTQITVILSLTEHCNLRCKYCYENDLRQKSIMSSDTIKKTVDYIASVIQNHPSLEEIHFDLIGGEPLLVVDSIAYLIKLMRPFSDKRVTYLIETNGTLFDINVQNILREVNATIHITLTPKEDHDMMRPFPGPISSYDMILSNLIAAKEFFENPDHLLALRYNVHRGNMEEFDEFISYMHKTLGYPFALETALIANYDYNDWQNPLSQDEYAPWNLSKIFEISDNMYSEERFFLNPKNCHPCIGYQPYSIKVHADGSLALCNTWKPINRQGNIDLLLSGMTKEQIFEESIPLRTLDDECMYCQDLFLCGGKRFCKGDDQCRFIDFDIDDYLKKYVKGRSDNNEGC